MIRLVVSSALIAVSGFAQGAAAPVSLLTDAQRNVLIGLAARQDAPWPPLTDEQRKGLHGRAERAWIDYREHHLAHGLDVGHRRSEPKSLAGLGESARDTGYWIGALAHRIAVENGKDDRAALHRALDALLVLIEAPERRGYLARFVAPAGEARYRVVYSTFGPGADPRREGMGLWAYRGTKTHANSVWLGNTRREAYDSVAFGLASAWRLVPDKVTRAKIDAIIGPMVERLEKDNWWIADGHGHFVWPVASFRAAWLVLASTTSPVRAKRLATSFESALDRYLSTGVRLRSAQARAYGPTVSEFERLWVVITLLPDGPRRKKGLDLITRTWPKATTHLNAHVAALVLTTKVKAPGASATLQGGLLDLPAAPWPTLKRRSTGPSMTALLPGDRAEGDFMWRHTPSSPAPDSGVHGRLDIVLPYWMGRLAGVIAAD